MPQAPKDRSSKPEGLLFKQSDPHKVVYTLV